MGEVIAGIVRRVIDKLPRGRAATLFDPACYMMELVRQAGDGDHLEIGVLHGATVIMAALVKEVFGLSGDVVGIDPLDGFYPGDVYNKDGNLVTSEIDRMSRTPVNDEVFWGNVNYFEVAHRVRLVKALSHPFPDELAAATFASAYIDGNHYKDAPLLDWENVRGKVSHLVWFDDCNTECPAVQRACKVAEGMDGWRKLDHYLDRVFVLERV